MNKVQPHKCFDQQSTIHTTKAALNSAPSMDTSACKTHSYRCLYATAAVCRRLTRGQSTVEVRSEPLLEEIRSLTRRLQQLQDQVSKKGGPSVQERREGRSMMVCWSCGERGHIARACPNRATLQQQENSIPSVVRACHEREEL